MRTRYWPLALVLGLGLGALIAAPAADEAPKADAERIAKLVKQLNSDDFDEREKATKDLEAIGAPALDALRDAAKKGDAEIKNRVAGIIRKVESKGANEKLLAPTKVKLSFKDTPLADAIAEFNKKSGYTIQLHDPEKKLKDRKVTLDTSEVTFWEAFDKFCEKAGLTEATFQDLSARPFPRGGPGGGLVPPGGIRRLPPDTAPPARTAPPAEKKEEKKEEKKDDGDKTQLTQVEAKPVEVKPAPPVAGPGGGVIGGPAIALPAMPFGPFGMGGNTITLKDGKPKSVPTCYSGSVRIRALKENPNGFAPLPVPPIGAFPGGAAPAKDEVTTIWLEVRAEPKLQLQFLQSVAVSKAVDDQDQKLEKAAPAGPGIPGVAPGGFGGAAPPLPPGGALRPAIAPAGIGGFGGFAMGGVQTYPVQLKKGDKEAKVLKEFAGTITAHAMSPAEAVITADKITKAAGESFKGKDGGRIKVNEVKEDDGKITVKFEMELPENVMPAGGGIGGIGGFGGGIGVPIGPPLPAPIPAPAPPPAPAAPPGGAGFGFQAPAPPAGVKVKIQIGAGGAAGGGGVIAAPGFRGFGSAPGITLVDDQGKTIAQSGGTPAKITFGGPGTAPVIEYTQEYKLAKDQKPAKLVFSGSKAVTIDVPFSFKDVPLK